MRSGCLSWTIVALTAWLVISPRSVHAWNSAGHRAVAAIAFAQLDEPTRKRVAELLRHHPAFEDWAQRPDRSPDEALDLFLEASVFADEARSEPYRQYHRAQAHYVNYPIRVDAQGQVDVGDEPLSGDSILIAYEENLRTIRDPQAALEAKALALSWIFHQVGDIHQPLHTVARFCPATPEGDRGGNEIQVPNPRGPIEQAWDDNLHAYWDDLVGDEDGTARVVRLATWITEGHPRDEFAARLGGIDVSSWALEGRTLAVESVYAGLDPSAAQLSALPPGYEERSRRVAPAQLALAGYRLADVLKSLALPD